MNPRTKQLTVLAMLTAIGAVLITLVRLPPVPLRRLSPV